MFFQLGIVNEIDRRPTHDTKTPETRALLLNQRKTITANLAQRYGFVPSQREHMPQATIVLDTSLSPDQRREDLSDSGKRYINKGKKQ